VGGGVGCHFKTLGFDLISAEAKILNDKRKTRTKKTAMVFLFNLRIPNLRS
jgi:hypothetical protein